MNFSDNSLCSIPMRMGPEAEELITNETYLAEFYQLERLSLVVCTWNNLPGTISQKWIERYLFYLGNCVFFYDDIVNEYFALPLAAILERDINGDPVRYTVRGFGSYRRELDTTNSVIIWNNYEHVSSSGVAGLFASRITNAIRTGDVHLEAHKVGKIIGVPDTKKKGVQELLNRVKNFCLYTIVQKDSFTGEEIKEINGQPEDYVLDKIDDHTTYLRHTALAYLGIDSISDKKSGMVAEEVAADTSSAMFNKLAILTPRDEACEKINKMFGLDVFVEIGGRRLEDIGDIYYDVKDSAGGGNKEDETDNI